MSQNLDEVSAGFERFNRAADNNKAAILEQLRRLLADGDRVLEIGSGSGQHAVFFADALPKVSWQPTDTEPYFASLQRNLQQISLPNLKSPLYLDVSDFVPPGKFHLAYCANVFHIMPAELIGAMFSGIGQSLMGQGRFVVYGPFKYGGAFTTASNESFHEWLKSQAPHQGIRDIEHLQEAASSAGMDLVEDNAMPSNNQLLVCRKTA